MMRERSLSLSHAKCQVIRDMFLLLVMDLDGYEVVTMCMLCCVMIILYVVKIKCSP